MHIIKKYLFPSIFYGGIICLTRDYNSLVLQIQQMYTKVTHRAVCKSTSDVKYILKCCAGDILQSKHSNFGYIFVLCRVHASVQLLDFCIYVRAVPVTCFSPVTRFLDRFSCCAGDMLQTSYSSVGSIFFRPILHQHFVMLNL